MNSYTAEDARRAAALGALWMDEHARGDWVSAIDLEALDLSSAELCLWGQAYTLVAGAQKVRLDWPATGYFRVLASLGMDQSRTSDLRWLSRHGFIAFCSLRDELLPEPEIEARYEMLTCAWIEQISMRLEARAAAVEEAQAALTVPAAAVVA